MVSNTNTMPSLKPKPFSEIFKTNSTHIRQKTHLIQVLYAYKSFIALLRFEPTLQFTLFAQ